MSKKRAAVLLLLLLIMTVFMTACHKSGTNKKGIKIFYLNREFTDLDDEVFSPKANTKEGVVTELLTILATDPKDLAKKAPIADFSLRGSELKGSAISLDFTSAYYNMETIEEVMTRTAIVNTLCSYSEIDTVYFYVEGEPLRDAKDELVGAMTSDDFIYNADTEMRNYGRAKLHLYFANESGDRLVDTYRSVVYNSNTSQERLVVEQMISGTSSDFAYSTLNPDTKIISVTTRDNICYVNLSGSFLSEPYKVSADVAIYSLVNSLTELDNVEYVQIAVDGDPNTVFMESLSLSGNFSANEGLVLRNDLAPSEPKEAEE